MVKASANKILFVTVIASLIGLPLFAQAQDKPLKKISWGVTSSLRPIGFPGSPRRPRSTRRTGSMSSYLA